MTGRVRRDAPVATWERVHGELPGTPGEYDRRMRARKVKLRIPPKPRTPPNPVAKPSMATTVPTKQTMYPPACPPVDGDEPQPAVAAAGTGAAGTGDSTRPRYHDRRAEARARHRAAIAADLRKLVSADSSSAPRLVRGHSRPVLPVALRPPPAILTPAGARRHVPAVGCRRRRRRGRATGRRSGGGSVGWTC